MGYPTLNQFLINWEHFRSNLSLVTAFKNLPSLATCSQVLVVAKQALAVPQSSLRWQQWRRSVLLLCSCLLPVINLPILLEIFHMSQLVQLEGSQSPAVRQGLVAKQGLVAGIIVLLSDSRLRYLKVGLPLQVVVLLTWPAVDFIKPLAERLESKATAA